MTGIASTVSVLVVAISGTALAQEIAPTTRVASPLRSIGEDVQGIRQLAIDPELLAQAEDALKRDGRFELVGFPLPGNLSVDLTLESISSFDRETRIEVETARGTEVLPIPDTTIMAGIVTDEPHSEAFIAFTAAGVEGWIRTNNVSYGISDGHGNEPSVHRMDLFDSMNMENFCQSDHIDQPVPNFKPANPQDDAQGGVAGFEPPPPCQRINLALETDQELMEIFGGEQGVSRIAIRRSLNIGKNIDIVSGCH